MRGKAKKNWNMEKWVVITDKTAKKETCILR